MEKFLFFKSDSGDRIVRTADVATFFSKLFTNGVFNNSCKVTANDNMSITVSKGYAFINGYFYYNDSDLILPISIADANQSRIDSIVLRYSRENRNITAQVIEGNYATNPIVPILERKTDTYDLRLANITINSGIGEITQDLIEDTRFSSECGNVTQAVSKIDTEDIFSQYDAAFKDWFNHIKNQLTTDAAGNLQKEIGNLNELDTKEKKDLVNAINEILNTSSGSLPTGSVTVFAGLTAPAGYLLCDGSAVSRTIYADLFNTIGTYYGEGDGNTTFNLPDLKGKVVAGLDNRSNSDDDFDILGKTGGEKEHTLTVDEMPEHRHRDIFWGSENYPMSLNRGSFQGYSINWEANSPGNSGINTGRTGGNKAHNNLQPYIVMNYIIKY